MKRILFYSVLGIGSIYAFYYHWSFSQNEVQSLIEEEQNTIRSSYGLPPKNETDNIVTEVKNYREPSNGNAPLKVVRIPLPDEMPKAIAIDQNHRRLFRHIDNIKTLKRSMRFTRTSNYFKRISRANQRFLLNLGYSINEIDNVIELDGEVGGLISALQDLNDEDLNSAIYVELETIYELQRGILGEEGFESWITFKSKLHSDSSIAQSQQKDANRKNRNETSYRDVANDSNKNAHHFN